MALDHYTQEEHEDAARQLEAIAAQIRAGDFDQAMTALQEIAAWWSLIVPKN